jgi:hypothetical protein
MVPPCPLPPGRKNGEENKSFKIHRTGFPAIQVFDLLRKRFGQLKPS